MDYPRQDIRITKTHKALIEALEKLSEEKAFNKITVNDLCQAAMVSRSTFYLHFEDKYQLFLYYLQLEQQQLDKLRKEEKDQYTFFHKIFSAIQNRQRIYKNILKAEANHELNQMLRAFFHTSMIQIVKESQEKGPKLSSPVSILAAYYASGIAGMIIQWIEEDFRYSPDEMTQCLYETAAAILLNDHE